MDAITVYELSKQYGDIPALRGLNLQVPQGSAFACVGEEGSGKTTLARLLAGLSRPTAGECSVCGCSPVFEAGKLHGMMGTVLDTAKLYEGMTLSENLNFFGGILNIDDNDVLDQASYLMHKLDIWEGRDEKIRELPTGVVRRASLARALIHRPKVLVMDEPSDGLDLESADSIRELISLLVKEDGLTFFLCTRNMDYAQSMCDDFAILKQGELLAKGGLETLRKAAGVNFRVAMKLGDGEKAPKGFQMVNGLWQKDVSSEEEAPKLIAQAVSEGRKIYESRLISPGLWEIYERLLAGGARKVSEIDEQREEDESWEEDGAELREPDEPAGFPGEAPEDEEI